MLRSLSSSSVIKLRPITMPVTNADDFYVMGLIYPTVLASTTNYNDIFALWDTTATANAAVQVRFRGHTATPGIEATIYDSAGAGVSATINTGYGTSGLPLDTWYLWWIYVSISLKRIRVGLRNETVNQVNNQSAALTNPIRPFDEIWLGKTQTASERCPQSLWGPIIVRKATIATTGAALADDADRVWNATGTNSATKGLFRYHKMLYDATFDTPGTPCFCIGYGNKQETSGSPNWEEDIAANCSNLLAATDAGNSILDGSELWEEVSASKYTTPGTATIATTGANAWKLTNPWNATHGVNGDFERFIPTLSGVPTHAEGPFIPAVAPHLRKHVTSAYGKSQVTIVDWANSRAFQQGETDGKARHFSGARRNLFASTCVGQIHCPYAAGDGGYAGNALGFFEFNIDAGVVRDTDGCRAGGTSDAPTVTGAQFGMLGGSTVAQINANITPYGNVVCFKDTVPNPSWFFGTKPVSGTLYGTAGQEITWGMLILKHAAGFAGTATPVSRATIAGANTVLGSAISIDAQVASHAQRSLTAGDVATYNGVAGTIVLQTAALNIQKGDVVDHQDGGTIYQGIASVTSVVIGGGTTSITFRQPLATTPLAGDLLAFARPAYQWITFTHSGGTNPYRGFDVEPAVTQGPIYVLAVGVKRVGIPGWIACGFGQDTNGYAEQFTFMAEEGSLIMQAIGDFADATAVVGWMANQGSTVVDHNTALLVWKNADRDVDTFAALDAEYRSDVSDMNTWRQAAFAGGFNKGTGVVSVLKHPTIGDLYEMFLSQRVAASGADVYHGDGNHPSGDGQQTQIAAFNEYAALATLTGGGEDPPVGGGPAEPGAVRVPRGRKIRKAAGAGGYA